MNILVIGAGYAGLVTAAGLADFGHSVVNLDMDSARIEMLRAGKSPLFEPGLQQILDRVTAAGRLSFVSSYDDDLIGRPEVVFLVVGSPPLADGSVDLSYLRSATESIVPVLSDGAVIVVKSTVPVGTARTVLDHLRELDPNLRVDVVSNPEFLRQGAAVSAFLEPDRIVVGSMNEHGAATMRQVYHPLLQTGTRAVFTTLESAEVIKYAANAFLATKVSFINEIADLCEATGAMVSDVARGIGLDARIGSSYLRPGPGFGGSCLPKDTAALLHTTRSYGVESQVINAVLGVNRDRISGLANRIERAVGGQGGELTVAVLGLTFKADTDDVRESPALHLVRELVSRGASLRVFDPQGMDAARRELGEAVAYAPDEYAAAAGADIAVIATEWKQFGSLSLPRLHEALGQPIVVDLRNMWDPAEMAGAGFRYFAIGQPDPA